MCLDILGACVIAAQLTNADIAYNNGMPTSVKDFAGNSHNTSQFFDDEQTNFFVEGYVILDTDTKINLGYNNGIDTAKYDVSKSYTLGVTQIFNPKENHYFTIGGSYTYGGKVRHTACVDSNGSEFFCPNLASINPFEKDAAVDHKVPYSINIGYTYKF